MKNTLTSDEDTIQKIYYTKPHAMGLKEDYNLDNIQELIAQLEGESAP